MHPFRRGKNGAWLAIRRGRAEFGYGALGAAAMARSEAGCAAPGMKRLGRAAIDGPQRLWRHWRAATNYPFFTLMEGTPLLDGLATARREKVMAGGKMIAVTREDYGDGT